jgi:hypothetical protein
MHSHVSKRLSAFVAVAAAAFVIAVAPTASAVGVTSEFRPTVSASDPLFQKWSGDGCPSGVDSTWDLHYTMYRLDVTDAGSYSYRDVGYLDDSDTYGTIDVEIGVYELGAFNPGSVGSNCIATIDDTGTVTFPSAGSYTLVVTTNDDDPGTGGGIFTLTGAGAITWSQLNVSRGEKPTEVVQQVGLPESGACDAVADADLGYGTSLTGGWTPSYAEWPRDGQGGPVCTRTLFFDPETGVWSVLGMAPAA